MNSADLIARYEWAEEQVVTFAHDDQASKFCDDFAWKLAETIRINLMDSRQRKRAAEALEVGRRRTEDLRAAEAHPNTVPGGRATGSGSHNGW